MNRAATYREFVRDSHQSYSYSVRMVNSATTAKMNGGGGVLPLASLNHISIVCRSVEESLRFYTDVLGFVPIRRPGSFNFDGAWYQFLSLYICIYMHASSSSLLPDMRSFDTC